MRRRGMHQSGLALLGWMQVAAAAGPTVGTQDPTGASGVWVLALLFALLAVALAVRRTALQRRLGALAARFHVARLPSARLFPGTASEPLQRISASLSSYRESLAYVGAALSAETSRRVAAHGSLRESEERYRLAVRGADDAIWEWDLRTDRAHFSARWKSLLGYAEHELSDRIDEWSQRIHPEDSERALQELRAHIEGRTVRLDSEHRLRHRDGTWRWVYMRATAVRDAGGEPSRLVGLVSDISARKQVECSLVEIAEALSAVTGEECLRELVHSFAAVLGVREAFVCECSDYPTTRVRMLARWKAGEFARCVDFDLAGTACEDVIREGRTVFAPRDAGERWVLEKQYERHSYLGIACLDSGGRVIGHIACADDKPMSEELPHQAILKIFAMRAAIELERSGLERERSQLSKSQPEWASELQGRA
jgi:PAS domain S-box-containing protein